MLRYGNDIYNRYNMRGKVDLNINPWLDLSTNTAFTFSDYDSPVFIDDLFFWNVNRTPSLSVPKNPDGTWTKDGASILGRLQDGDVLRMNIDKLRYHLQQMLLLLKRYGI